MDREKSELKQLPQGKTMLFSSNIFGETDCVVRTGTHCCDNPCTSFIGAVLTAYSKEFASMTADDSLAYVKKFKKSMWKAVVKSPVVNEQKTILEDVFYFLENYKSKNAEIKSKTSAKLILDFVVSDIDFYVLLFCNILSKKDTLQCVKYEKEDTLKKIMVLLMESSLLQKLDSVKRKKVQDKTFHFFTAIHEAAQALHSSTSECYSNGAKDDPNNPECVKLLETKLQRTIYILDSNSGDKIPDINYNTVKPSFPLSVVVLKVDDNHYEPLGKLLERNRIKREFSSGESVIESIEYLMREQKTEGKECSTLSSASSSDSESESSSDSEIEEEAPNDDGEEEAEI